MASTKKQKAPSTSSYKRETNLYVANSVVRTKNSVETREALLFAARLRFAVDGYQATSLRAIAHDARVDVALISRYFGSKEGLFESVVTFERQRISAATRGKMREVVKRLVENVLQDPLGDKGDLLSTLLRSSSHPPALDYMSSILQTLEEDLANLSAASDKKLRASLVTALLVGVALQRRVLKKKPLADVSAERLSPAFTQAITALLGKN